ncbi:uncharacterized protein LOC119217615 [Tachysurus ichikawai]
MRGGLAPPPLTNAEEMALSLNAGRPMAEGILGGTSSEPVTPEDLSTFIKFYTTPHPRAPHSVEEQQEEGPSTSGAQMNTVQ